MTDNNWPDPVRPGVPLNPERDGWHWVQNGKGRPSCQQWKAGMWSISGEGGWTAAQVATLLHLRYIGPCLLPFEITDAERKEISDNNWPDPTPEMLNGDPIFDAIWGVIKWWDINVPAIYSGYCGATGNHARAIRDAIGPVLTPAEVDARVKEARRDALEEAARWHNEQAERWQNTYAKETLSGLDMQATRILCLERGGLHIESAAAIRALKGEGHD
jgi:hypothetical protein